jgi:flagellar motor switch protein FliM
MPTLPVPNALGLILNLQMPSPNDDNLSVTHPSEPSRKMRIREIDFTRPTKFSAEEQRRLEQLHESFCRRASMRLSLELHSSLEMEVIDSEQTIWQAALTDFDQNSVGAICTTQEGQQILIIAEAPFLLRIINMMLGGGHSRPLATERGFTDIDEAVVGHFMEEVTEILSDSWNDFAGITFSFVGVQADKTAIYPMAALNEAVLSITIEAKMNDTSGTIALIFPHHAISHVQKALQSNSYRSSGKKTRADAAHLALQPSEVKLYAEAASLTMSVSQILALKEGDEIDLGFLPDEIDLYVEDEPVYRVAPAYQGEKHVVVVKGRKDKKGGGN